MYKGLVHYVLVAIHASCLHDCLHFLTNAFDGRQVPITTLRITSTSTIDRSQPAKNSKSYSDWELINSSTVYSYVHLDK